VGKLREIRRGQDSSGLISLSGADPLNLAGILFPGPKLSVLTAIAFSIARESRPRYLPAAKSSSSNRSKAPTNGKLKSAAAIGVRRLRRPTPFSTAERGPIKPRKRLA